MPHESLKRTHHNKVFVTVMCHNDELSLTIKWVGCLLPDSEIFILFAENSRILLKMLVIPIVLTFMYLVAPNLLVNNQLTSSLWHITVTLLLWIMPLKILRLWFQPRGCIRKKPCMPEGYEIEGYAYWRPLWGYGWCDKKIMSQFSCQTVLK